MVVAVLENEDGCSRFSQIWIFKFVLAIYYVKEDNVPRYLRYSILFIAFIILYGREIGENGSLAKS